MSFEFTPDPNDEKRDAHFVRKVTLPSGKEIEVVYFENTDEYLDTLNEHNNQAEELTICRNPDRPDCISDLTYPIEWNLAGPNLWEVTLRCPNCEWSHTGVYDQATVEIFDEDLDRGTEKVVRDLKSIIIENRLDEADRVAKAFIADAIEVQDIRDWSVEPNDTPFTNFNILEEF